MDTVESTILRRRVQSAGSTTTARPPQPAVTIDRARPPTTPSAAAEVILASGRLKPGEGGRPSSSAGSGKLKYYPPCDASNKTPQQKQAEEIRRQQQFRPPSSPRASYIAAERVLSARNGATPVSASELKKAHREVADDPFENVIRAALDAARENRNDPMKQVALAGGLLGVHSPASSGPVINPLTGALVPDPQGDLDDPDTRIISLTAQRYHESQPYSSSSQRNVSSATVNKYREKLQRVMKETDGPAFRATERTKFSQKVPMSSFNVKLHVDDMIAQSAQIAATATASNPRPSTTKTWKGDAFASNNQQPTSATTSAVFSELDTVVTARKTLVALKAVPEHVFKSNAYLQQLFGNSYSVLEAAVGKNQRQRDSVSKIVSAAEIAATSNEPSTTKKPESPLAVAVGDETVIREDDESSDDEVFLGPSVASKKKNKNTRKGSARATDAQHDDLSPRPQHHSQQEDTEALAIAANNAIESKIFIEWNAHLESLRSTMRGTPRVSRLASAASNRVSSSMGGGGSSRAASGTFSRPSSHYGVEPRQTVADAKLDFTEEELRVMFADFVAKRGYTEWAAGGGNRFDPLRMPYSDVRRGSGERSLSRPGSANSATRSRPTSGKAVRAAAARTHSGGHVRPLSGRPPQSATKRRPESGGPIPSEGTAAVPPVAAVGVNDDNRPQTAPTMLEDGRHDETTNDDVPTKLDKPANDVPHLDDNDDGDMLPNLASNDTKKSTTPTDDHQHQSRPASVLDDLTAPSQDGFGGGSGGMDVVATPTASTRRDGSGTGKQQSRPANTPMMGSRPSSKYERPNTAVTSSDNPAKLAQRQAALQQKQHEEEQQQLLLQQPKVRRTPATPNPPGGLFIRSGDRTARVQQLVDQQERSAEDRIAIINKFKKDFIREQRKHDDQQQQTPASSPVSAEGGGGEKPHVTTTPKYAVTEKELDAVDLSHLPQSKVDELYRRIVDSTSNTKHKRRSMSPKIKKQQQKQDAITKRQQEASQTLKRSEVDQHYNKHLSQQKRHETHQRQQSALYNRHNVVHLPGVVDQRFKRTLLENPPVLGVEGTAQRPEPLGYDTRGAFNTGSSPQKKQGGILFL